MYIHRRTDIQSKSKSSFANKNRSNLVFPLDKSSNCIVSSSREGGGIGLFITLVPKVFK